MNRYLIASIIALLIFAPSAMADTPNPVPGQRLCYHYSDGTEGSCSIFPSMRYIAKTYVNTGSMKRFIFEDGSYLDVNYPSMDINAPISAPTFGKWGWVAGTTFMADKPIPVDLSTDYKHVKYACTPFRVKKVLRGVIGMKGINCRNIVKLLAKKSLKGTGWSCHASICRKSNRVWFSTQAVVISDAAPSKDLAKPCGQYHVDKDYVVWAHDCGDASDALIDSWIDSLSGNIAAPVGYACGFNLAMETTRCSAPHGCLMISTGAHDLQLSGIEFYGQYVQLPRDSCTQIDLK